MPHPSRRLARSAVALVSAVSLATAGLLVGTAAAAADPAIAVHPSDIDTGVNVSADSTAWDRNPGANQSAYADAAFSPEDLPISGGAPWKLDMEDKPLGLLEVDDSGLVLGASAADSTKAKVQYYIGSGGYPTIDAQSPTLADLFDQSIGWTQALVSGANDYGVTMQIQLQKEVAPGQWARVTLVSDWAPGTGARDLRAGKWFANTDIHADGFLDGAKVNNRQSGPGVEASVILANFGDFDVVSFGPNLGRDGRDYVYSLQDLEILGTTFHFTPVPSVAVVVSSADIGATVDDRTAAWTKANVDNLGGRYEIVADSAVGGVLELETVGGASGVGTQAKLMHYFASRTYPLIDSGASVVGADPVATIPLSELLAHSVSATYRASTYLSLQIEIYYGENGYTTLYQNGAASADWASFSVDPDAQWISSRELLDASGARLAVCGNGAAACAAGAKVTLANLLAGLGDQDPRAISVGVNKGRDSDATIAGLVQIRQIAFGGMEFSFVPAPTLHVDPYYVSSALYKGIGVDVKATGITDATEVRVTLHRSVGGDVVKTSKPDGVVVPSINAGTAVTAPIVIQPGTYDEAASSSWVRPSALWAAETVPTGVTVDVLRGDEVLLSETRTTFGSAGGASLAAVMPSGTPAFTNPAANFHDAADYKGIVVDVRVDHVTDAEQIIVKVNRSNGPAVVKTSKPGAAFLATINSGQPKSVTVPIVIQPGTYDEAASSSWIKPGAVWTPTSVPTSVTLTIDRRYGADIVTTIPIGSGPATAADVLPVATPPVVITVPTDEPLDVSVPEGATDVSLDLGTPTVPGEVTVPVQVSVQSAAGANLVIPAATKITAADPAWDGVIKLPTVKENVTVTVPGKTTTVAVAIEVGSSTTRLEFEVPVQLVLVGQAGKSAGYIQGGVFHAIGTACPVTAPAGMTSDECWFDDGADLVIWTTHFTTFVSYDAVEETGGGGSGSGGGGTTGGTTGGTGGSGTSGGGTAAGSPVATATPTPTPSPTSTPRSTPSPAPTSDVPAEPEETTAVAQAEGGFDPVLLIVIVAAVAVLGAGVATIVTLRRRAQG